jgi:hypothetical protein
MIYLPHQSEGIFPMSSFWKKVMVGMVIMSGLCVAFWYTFLEPIRVHMVWERRIRADIEMLAQKPPAGVTKGQWDFVVNWTINLHANCGASYSFLIDLDWRDPFANELERRLAGPMSLSDIEWIWDEYALHTKSGQKYSDRYRPTRQEGFDQIKWGHIWD